MTKLKLLYKTIVTSHSTACLTHRFMLWIFLFLSVSLIILHALMGYINYDALLIFCSYFIFWTVFTGLYCKKALGSVCFVDKNVEHSFIGTSELSDTSLHNLKQSYLLNKELSKHNDENDLCTDGIEYSIRATTSTFDEEDKKYSKYSSSLQKSVGIYLLSFFTLVMLLVITTSLLSFVCLLTIGVGHGNDTTDRFGLNFKDLNKDRFEVHE